MSELKATKIELNNHGKPIASIQGTTSYYGISPNDTFYSQEEADKVIAELKEEASTAHRVCSRQIQQIASNEQEIRHNKYKRCMAMADKCVDLCNKAKDLYRWAEDENLEHHYNRKIEFFARWHNRWRKLADEFKETK